MSARRFVGARGRLGPACTGYSLGFSVALMEDRYIVILQQPNIIPFFTLNQSIYGILSHPMRNEFDKKDLKILQLLQTDATASIEELAEQVDLSRNACWRRIKTLEYEGVISKRVAILNPEPLGLDLMVYVLIRDSEHDSDWVKQLRIVVAETPEIVSAHRMSGDLDYVLRIRVKSVADYDRLYQQLIKRIRLSSISASFVMENIKETTALPIN